ncbi:MAG: diaminopimelate decarboxylase [Alphaproteobacteria bacterium]|nr:diaminopimelate decarboxylase [Alphaproteobacteria bacterium]
MDHFNYKHGVLYAEDVPVSDIVKQVGTPVYIYSSATIQRHYRVFLEPFPSSLNVMLCYAVKANDNNAIIKLLANEGAGVDAVSGGEIRRARIAGVNPKKIVFSGVGKTTEEMAYALTERILQFNVESEEELRTLSQVAESLGMTANIAIRLNPDIDAGTHHKISTGKKEHKFGVEWQRAKHIYRLAADLPGINPCAISMHIGSQLLDLEPFRKAFSKIAELLKMLRGEGHIITRLDLGGGLGIPYHEEVIPPTPKDYADVVSEATKDLGCSLVFEPGRLIVGNSGILVTQVIYEKKTESRNFLIVDAAMNNLIRPTLYDAYHHIIPVVQSSSNTVQHLVDVVGPICETGDVLAMQRLMPTCNPGDLLAIRSAGAYGSVMGSTYNSRPLLAEVMVKGDTFDVIRPRQTYEELFAKDHIPTWLKA